MPWLINFVLSRNLKEVRISNLEMFYKKPRTNQIQFSCNFIEANFQQAEMYKRISWPVGLAFIRYTGHRFAQKACDSQVIRPQWFPDASGNKYMYLAQSLSNGVKLFDSNRWTLPLIWLVRVTSYWRVGTTVKPLATRACWFIHELARLRQLVAPCRPAATKNDSL